MGTVLSILSVLIIGQIVSLQLNPQQVEHFLEESTEYSGKMEVIKPTRGKIYDRWGHLLAGNSIVYEVGVELAYVKNPHTIALAMNVVLGKDYKEILDAASTEPSEDAIYMVIDDFVSQEKIDQLTHFKDDLKNTNIENSNNESPSLNGLVFHPHLQRSYAEKELASNILGFVSREGKGYFGVEENYNDLLGGTPLKVWVPNDPNKVEELPETPEGASLILTIDREIQRSMELIIDKAIQESGAQSGTIVVLDPRNGEIISLASTPRLDLNKYWEYSEIYTDSTPFNRAVSQAYEPGSVFKVLTMATALDTGAVKPETSFVDTGVFEIGGAYIRNWNSGAWGPQNMQGCLQHSLNVCLAWVASQVGAKDFYPYIRAFGIGHLSGVDLAGDVAGRLKTPGDEDWYDADLGTNAFGQGVSATPLQMAVAISAIANDGKIMSPRIVHSIVNDDRQYNTKPRISSNPITPETARTLSEMLANSLEEEASTALVEGYRLAGKTGTAEIPTPYGYTSNVTNASFVGWGPADDPQFLVYIWLEEPLSSPWGSVVAAPVFHQAAEKLVVLLNIPPDNIRSQLDSH